MKIVEHRGLWSAIQQFSLDDPNAEITFSSKLSAKQNWSPFFTERVVEEYRKFLFLCCISPNGASPSQAVDEAWHLHLTYTRSYWIDLCKNTLGKDIHHHPSRGGDDEDHKHIEWYKDTLALYQSVFESPPPDDIWPHPREEDQTIPEPAWKISNEIKALIVLLLLLPFVISAYMHGALSPYSLNGPQFLSFFPLLAISCIICFVILQYEKGQILKGLVTKHFPSDATIFQTAQFIFGKHRAIQAAIVDLMRRNLMGLTADQRFILHKNWYSAPANEQNPLINGFLNERYDITNYEGIAGDWYNEDTAQHPALQKLYWLAYYKESMLKRFHMLVIPLLAGIARILQGLTNGKAIGFLFSELIVFLVIAFIIENLCSRKIIVINAVKELLESRNDMSATYPDHVVSEFATNGDQAIQWFSDGLVLAAMFSAYPVLNHKNTTTSNGGCSSCSGCSGGGDGGGGCGGGCGGCGGGCGS